jgi:N-acetylneuraminate synthase/sialic acid synthase
VTCRPDIPITPEDIAIKSPGDGLPPYELDKVVGRNTLRALNADEDICFDVLSGANMSIAA